jgi:hypothetical protein
MHTSKAFDKHGKITENSDGLDILGNGMILPTFHMAGNVSRLKRKLKNFVMGSKKMQEE